MTDHDAREALAKRIAQKIAKEPCGAYSNEVYLGALEGLKHSLPAPTPAAETQEAFLRLCEEIGIPATAGAYLEYRSRKAPAAGEAVAWMYSHPQLPTTVRLDRHPPIHPQWGHTETPLYAAPQPPATGGDAVEVIDGANSHVFDKRLMLGGEGGECIAFADEPWASRLAAALANHSPDAGGVGEVWVCDGIPDEAIEAGISAWDAAKHDMENYVSGVTTDWDEGMIVAAIYKAMSASIHPGLRAGEE